MPAQTTFRRPRHLQQTTHSAEAMYQLLYGAQASGVSLPATQRTLLGLAGAWAAVNRIANATAMMLTEAQVQGTDSRPRVVDDPCSEYDPFTFWKTLVATALCRGNAIGVPYDVEDGWPQQVLLVPPDAVDAYYDEAGYLVYQVGGQILSADQVVHARVGVSIPGEPLTIGVIEAHRRGIEAQLSLQGTAASVWKEGAVPSGVVQLDVMYPTTDQATTVKTNWVNTLGGRRTVAVTGKAMTYTPVTWNARDAEFLESRQFTFAESALMFGLRPEDLGTSLAGSTAMTYGNRTDDALQRITDAYTPILYPIELTWSRRLLPAGVRMRGNPEALLRSTTEQRYQLHKLAQEIGVETPEETRDMERKDNTK